MTKKLKVSHLGFLIAFKKVIVVGMYITPQVGMVTSGTKADIGITIQYRENVTIWDTIFLTRKKL